LFFFTDVPFARLDNILLLAKNHLKGDIPRMLNEKDNQVFIDYLAGGQSKQIATEREANAQSSGVLSMAARNLQGIGETANPCVEGVDKISQALGGDCGMGMIKAVSKETGKLAVKLMDVVTLMDAQVDMSSKLHAQMKKQQLETRIIHADAHRQDLKRKQECLDHDLKCKELDLRCKQQMHEQDMLHKKQMLELRMEEAKAEEMFAKARQMVMQAENQSLASPSPVSPISVSTGPMDYGTVGMSLIPSTLQQLDTLFAGVSESLQLQLKSIRLVGYEEAMKDRLNQFDQKVKAEASNDKDSAKRREKLNSKLSESLEHVQHYCHLVFWTLAKTHLTPQMLHGMLGSSFNLAQTSSNNTQYVTWSNIDEKKFGLPVDLDNVPKAVMDSDMWQAALRVRVEEMARKWAACQCEKVYSRQQRRVSLWRFKALVVEMLCKVAQKEIMTRIQ
jgi:hypothetical protein